MQQMLIRRFVEVPGIANLEPFTSTGEHGCLHSSVSAKYHKLPSVSPVVYVSQDLHET